MVDPEPRGRRPRCAAVVPVVPTPYRWSVAAGRQFFDPGDGRGPAEVPYVVDHAARTVTLAGCLLFEDRTAVVCDVVGRFGIPASRDAVLACVDGLPGLEVVAAFLRPFARAEDAGDTDRMRFELNGRGVLIPVPAAIAGSGGRPVLTVAEAVAHCGRPPAAMIADWLNVWGPLGRGEGVANA